MASNTEPIPVSEALRLCELAIEDCDKASAAPWRQRATPEADFVEGFDEEPICSTYRPSDLWGKAMANAAFIVLARATMREMLGYVQYRLREAWQGYAMIGYIDSSMYPPLAALRAHYDRVRPGWRQE